MNINFKNNWEETLQRFDAWFHHEHYGRPLLNIWTTREPGEIACEPIAEKPYDDTAESYLNPDKVYARVFNENLRLKPIAEAFPKFSMNLGAGSMALYLGSEPDFQPETVWFKPFIKDYASNPIRFDPDNYWWQKHLEILRRQVELTKDTDIAVCIPDIVENIDILSAMRDPQECCMDLYDDPEAVKAALECINDSYPKYYDAIYDIVKRPDGSSAFTAFDIIGSNKTAKIQCDLAALMSPAHFNEFVLPCLIRQCGELDNTLFHLDGPEALCHVDSLMSIENLGALQWTTGSRNPRSGDERWYDLYKKVKNANKGMWVYLADYELDEAVGVADKLVKKFGGPGFYFHFPVMKREQAEGLLLKAEKEWK